MQIILARVLRDTAAVSTVYAYRYGFVNSHRRLWGPQVREKSCFLLMFSFDVVVAAVPPFHQARNRKIAITKSFSISTGTCTGRGRRGDHRHTGHAGVTEISNSAVTSPSSLPVFVRGNRRRKRKGKKPENSTLKIPRRHRGT